MAKLATEMNNWEGNAEVLMVTLPMPSANLLHTTTQGAFFGCPFLLTIVASAVGH